MSIEGYYSHRDWFVHKSVKSWYVHHMWLDRMAKTRNQHYIWVCGCLVTLLTCHNKNKFKYSCNCYRV